MTTMAGPRKTISIHDYPEHLNPFREEDNHNKIRFWTIGRKLSRSNSITFSGIKDFRNSWSLRSFMRKGKKGEQSSSQSSKPTNTNHVNGDNSPIVFRRALQYSSGAGARSTVGSPERADRYVYGGSVTPLPRSRFQERLRTSQHDTNSPSATPRMARSDITGSRLSVESSNPFEEEAPIPPVRASRRKKKRAPAPPAISNANDTVTENLELRIAEDDNAKKPINVSMDEDVEEMNLKVELKIVEDEDKPIVEQKLDNHASKLENEVVEHIKKPDAESEETKEIGVIKEKDIEELKEPGPDSETEVSEISFPKIDISKYRRNSSVNEDEIRLRRGNLEDFHSLAPNKRSKSLSHTLDGSFVAYHTNLNEKTIDINSNEEPQRVVCKVYDEDTRKQSVDNSISSTEKEFLEIDKATRELEREISKLNSALIEDDLSLDNSRLSVSEIRLKFDKPDTTCNRSSPNPIPKPRRSGHYGGTNSPVNGNIPIA